MENPVDEKGKPEVSETTTASRTMTEFLQRDNLLTTENNDRVLQGPRPQIPSQQNNAPPSPQRQHPGSSVCTTTSTVTTSVVTVTLPQQTIATKPTSITLTSPITTAVNTSMLTATTTTTSTNNVTANNAHHQSVAELVHKMPDMSVNPIVSFDTEPTLNRATTTPLQEEAMPSASANETSLSKSGNSITRKNSEPNVNERVQQERLICTDNGIFDFMTPDRAIELYKRIHSQGIPELEWKFYGRRKPGEQEEEETKESNELKKNNDENYEISQNQIANTEFDFGDEDFGDLPTDSPLVNESLQLKKRESGAERKTNLSDIMSDIMKESHAETE